MGLPIALLFSPKQKKDFKKDRAALHGISKRYDNIKFLNNFIQKFIKINNVTHITHLAGKNDISFQTKSKRVVILCLFCILVHRQHIFPEKSYLKKGELSQTKNIF